MEHGFFSPLVFTPYGGASRETELVIKILCAKVASKRNLEYSVVTNWNRFKISFTLLKFEISHFLYSWLETLEVISRLEL